MEYLLKKRLFNLENKFVIKNEGIIKYYTKLDRNNNQKELYISNVDGEKVIKIVGIESGNTSEFKSYLYGRMVLKTVMRNEVYKQISFRSIYGDEYEVVEHKGSIEFNNYIIRKNGLRVAKAFRKPLAPMDEYIIDIIEAENQALILAIAIIVDECF